MSFSVKLEQFEGPLMLLLELIETEKLEISKISLAKVTDAYIQRLNANPQIPPEELADFLVLASRLLLIKSRILLPFLDLGPEEAIGDLEAQLKIYKEYLDASKVIHALILKKRFTFVHEKLPHVEIGFSPPLKLAPADMCALLKGVIRRLDWVVRVPKAVVEKSISIHEKIRQIQEFLVRAANTSFRELVGATRSRVEIVVSFLALLELVKQKFVSVSQDQLFDDITVSKIETEIVMQPN